MGAQPPFLFILQLFVPFGKMVRLILRKKLVFPPLASNHVSPLSSLSAVLLIGAVRLVLAVISPFRLFLVLWVVNVFNDRLPACGPLNLTSGQAGGR